MEKFISQFSSIITGVLCGFDRLVFRGSLLPLIRDGGMFSFLCQAGIRLLDFKPFVLSTSQRLKESSLAEAHKADRPIVYLHSSGTNKEDLARKLLVEYPVDKGLICVLKVVESCMSFEYHRSPNPKERGLKLRPRKCLHLYKYYLHHRFGFINARIQTWFPFNVQICLNGREWLGRQFERKGYTDFKRHDNCFPFLGDPKLAQRLIDRQLETNWPRALDAIARSLNPMHPAIFKPSPQSYYWSVYQAEWATDVMFKDPRSLATVYPALVSYAMANFSSPDVMRFLGRKAHGNYTGELVTSFKDRAEGVRVKHWVNGNSLKMYDKAGSILRVETTTANPKDFKVYRPKQDGPEDELAWLPMRKGVADIHRRAQVSQRANENYLEALSAVDNDTPLSEILDRVSRHSTYRGRRVRAMRVGDRDDLKLLEAVSRGEFAVSGFRNRDLRQLLFPGRLASTQETRRRSARISRQIRLLRAHGIIRKIPKSYRYRLTTKGQLLTAALFAARTATVKQLLRDAA